MDTSKLMEIFQSGNVVIPIYLLKRYKELKLELDELVFLMYLVKFGNHYIFDPSKISSDLNWSLESIMNLISSLTEKGYVQITSSENDKGFVEEMINLDDYYSHLKLLIIGDIEKNKEKKKDDSDTIYSYLEQKFGRTLSSIDYEIIQTWLESNYNEDLIKRAVDEAVLNGVSTLKYIDRILYEWAKKGIEKVSDLDKKKTKSSNSKQDKVDDDIDLGILDLDWFDDDEE